MDTLAAMCSYVYSYQMVSEYIVWVESVIDP